MFCTSDKITRGFISHGKYLKTDLEVFSLTLPAMEASSAPSFPFSLCKIEVALASTVFLPVSFSVLLEVGENCK